MQTDYDCENERSVARRLKFSSHSYREENLIIFWRCKLAFLCCRGRDWKIREEQTQIIFSYEHFKGHTYIHRLAYLSYQEFKFEWDASVEMMVRSNIWNSSWICWGSSFVQMFAESTPPTGRYLRDEPFAWVDAVFGIYGRK